MSARRGGPGVFAVAVFAATLVGCGSDGETSATEYRADFEALCVQLEADIVDIDDRMRDVDDGSDEQLELVREQAVVTEKFTDGVAKLRPPSELDADHQALLGHITDAAAATAAVDFEAAQAASNAAQQLISDLGIEGCG